MKIINFTLLVIALALIIQPLAEAQTVLKASVMGNGGAHTEGGGMRLNGTLGQPAIGVSSNTSNGMFAGFWYMVAPPEAPEIGVNPAGFIFNAPSGGPNPASKKLNLTNTGGGMLSWSVSDNATWLSLNPTSGTCTNETDEVTLSVNVSGLADGVYNGNVTVTATGASNTPQILPVKLAIGPVAVFQRQLKEGWNHVSYSINQCFYTGTEPADQPSCVDKVNLIPQFASLSAWFSSVITPSTAWKMVIGQKGAMDSDLPPAFHSLKYMSPISGYWVNIKAGTGGAVLSITGPPFDPTCAIPLITGWNQIGFPLDNGYYDTASPPTNMPWITDWQQVAPPVADYVFKSVEGKYDIIIGEFGAYNPTLPPAFSTLRNIASGCGYWIKVKQNVNLKYSDMGISAFAAPGKNN